MVTVNGIDGWVRILEGTRDFSLLQYHPDRLWCPRSLLSNGYWRIFTRGLKQLGSEADHSPPSRVKVKNGDAIPSLLDTFSWHGV
jgi:hypothetical protein